MPSLAQLLSGGDVNQALPEAYQDPNQGLAPILQHLGSSIGKVFMAPGQALQSTQPMTSEDMIKPAADLAMMTTLGAGAVPQEANALNMGIKAYHGSPHDFDAFDLSKIGTGEGAQAYGHGLYFADKEGVAKAYQATLGQDPEAFNVAGNIVEKPSPEFAAANLVHKFQDSPSAIAGRLPDEPAYADIKDVLAKWGDKAPDITPGRGKMYEVNINADPDQFLDWDKPLSEQSPAIQDAVKPLIENTKKSFPRLEDNADLTGPLRGQDFYRAYASHRAHQDFASEGLNQAGIPGIKYLDQGSRAAGDGSRNYVVFNDKLIDILKKYGMVGAIPAAGAGFGGLAQQAQPST